MTIYYEYLFSIYVIKEDHQISQSLAVKTVTMVVLEMISLPRDMRVGFFIFQKVALLDI